MSFKLQEASTSSLLETVGCKPLFKFNTFLSRIGVEGRISRQSLAIDFTSHRSSRQRQSSHVSHANVTQSPNPFQHYSQCSGNFTSLASASPPNPP
ncbi:hypothetical protein O181_046887 [Austropuccinia psidii MF-1]|uniref:Uncharacterized protein n=1 Tax=Austropuccinia psidii MF-1 TaxID=1389203 RepID=A0A9Q3DS59_9BASI|nr:hypothetical protein [Austropuccinia psidii MF-1]